MTNLLHQFFRRVLPKDPSDLDRPGALGLYFDSPLFWFFKGCFEYHDEMYERIGRGETELTYRQADMKFIECLKKHLQLHSKELTGAQRRWAAIVINAAYVACRGLNTLRGEK